MRINLFNHLGKVARFLSTTTSSKSSASVNRSVDLSVNDDDDYNESTKKKSVVIGNVGLSMHSDRRGPQVPLSSNPSADPLSAIADAVFVGVVFIGGFLSPHAILQIFFTTYCMYVCMYCQYYSHWIIIFMSQLDLFHLFVSYLGISYFYILEYYNLVCLYGFQRSLMWIHPIYATMP